MPTAEPMLEGSNEAEWIVDCTTHADRDGKCVRSCHAPCARLFCLSHLCRSLG